MRCVVFGLDGASFNLLNGMIERGNLPNIEKIVRTGVHLDMESCLPPVTSPNWKCYSTGKNPGKLGVFWWENIDLAGKRVYFPRERLDRHKEIWDYLGNNGFTVGVINTPLTYPPKKVRGFMISGGPDANDSGFAYPKEIERWLKRELNYKVNARWLNHLKTDQEKAVGELYELIQSRFDAARMLINKYQPDFLHLTIFYINTLQHYFWNNEYVERGWKIIDRNIGKMVDKDSNVFLMSDHGTNEVEQVFYINSWFELEGYLKLKRMREVKLLYRLGVTKENMWRIAQKLRLLSVAKKVVPKSITDSLPTDLGNIVQAGKTSTIDWDNLVAIASGQGPVYINAESGEKEKVVKELVQKLENLVNPDTGKRVVSKVYRKEKIYFGDYLAEAPDIVIDQSVGTHTRGDIGNREVFESTAGWRAENRRHGIFAACGPDIIKSKMKKVSILDMAPTILALFGIVKKGDMDGRILPCIKKGKSLKVKVKGVIKGG